MELELSSQQEILKRTARDFLERECPKTLVREMETNSTGFSSELWQKMADLGWMGVAFPEHYGGTGGNILDLVVLLEEMGRALVPSPFISTVVLTGLPILNFGTEAQKQELLPKIVQGHAILALALNEKSGKYDAESIQCRAEKKGDSYVLNGSKMFVRDAQISDFLLCAARTGEGSSSTDSISLFLIDSRSKGISFNSLISMASDRQAEVIFANVEVPSTNILGGEPGNGWQIVESIMQWGALALCGEMVGGAQWVLEKTVDYARERVQFGRPIGSFQAIQHKCSDMVTDMDSSKFITYYAAWEMAEGLPCKGDVSRAKAWVSDAYRRIIREGHQIHGGIGFTRDHDLQLYFRRQKAAEIQFGDAKFHRKIVAKELLG